MSHLIISPEAEQDLDTALTRIGMTNPERAEAVGREVWRIIRLIATMPRMGRSRSDLGPGLRSFAVNPLVVFYYYEEEDWVNIARILHERQDHRAAFQSISELEEE